ncbi:MAG: hypothetical protein N2039_12600 [Gemmataceae bacterium]|nr:hypothetical protein [Gemmataceae bacterium]
MTDPSPAKKPLELLTATLPREQIGPFLLLGVDKDATLQEIEAAWRQRVEWVEQGQLGVSVDDLNWAKEILLDADRRILADLGSLNPDTSDGQLRQMLAVQGSDEWERPHWPIRDVPLPDAPSIPAEWLDDRPADESSLHIPDVPLVIPGLERILAESRQQPVDPWDP